MTETVKVILSLSDDIQQLLEQQKIDLYEEIEQESPSIRLEVISDPDAPAGSRDLTTVILATATLVSTLTPIIIRILNQFKSDSTEFLIDETETRQADNITIHRTCISSKKEYNRQSQQIQHLKSEHDKSIDGTSN